MRVGLEHVFQSELKIALALRVIDQAKVASDR
jgi:hypothetical protein